MLIEHWTEGIIVKTILVSHLMNVTFPTILTTCSPLSKTMAMFSSLISQSSNLVMAGVKNLVVKKHNLPLTKIVDDIMAVSYTHLTLPRICSV